MRLALLLCLIPVTLTAADPSVRIITASRTAEGDGGFQTLTVIFSIWIEDSEENNDFPIVSVRTYRLGAYEWDYDKELWSPDHATLCGTGAVTAVPGEAKTFQVQYVLDLQDIDENPLPDAGLPSLVTVVINTYRDSAYSTALVVKPSNVPRTPRPEE